MDDRTSGMDGSGEVQLWLDSEATSVARARRFVLEALAEWKLESIADHVVLVASELITNAILHGGDSPTMRLRLAGARLRVEVADGNDRLPRRRPYDFTATTGRGMVLVEALVSRWGAEALAGGGGKIVWCEFDLD